MARPSVSAQCDLVASYMDGVHVKIAEAYKPPRKVCLPAAYNNRLPDVTKLSYDFSLERSVLEKMAEWREVREANMKGRHARLNEKRKKEKEKEEATQPPPPPPLPDNIKQMPVKTPVPETTILTPQPLSPPVNDLQDVIKTNGLNFADFDNDTSSPFDNMELKTINDMEELAQVLQPTSQWIPAAKLESILNELTIDDQTEHQTEEKEDRNNQSNNQEEVDEQENIERRTVSTIVQELQKDLERPFVENWKPWRNLESPDNGARGTIKQEETTLSSHTPLANVLADLTEEDKKLSRHLCDMGFPLLRAAKAVRDLGREDNKKVVEYLLAVQSLEEMGISGEEAEKALAVTQYDQSKAKTYYENLCTLRDLGFPEDKASAALLKCNIDRDKALDFLIA